MQYCSLQHWILLLSPVTSTTGYCFCFGSIPSFFLELFLHWSPVAYWALTDLGSSSFSILSFCLFILFMGFSEKTMALHSSTLAWKIPWPEEPGRLQSTGSLRVGHDWAISLSLLTFMHWRRHGTPLQCSCLETPRDRGAWWAAVYGVAQSRTRQKWLSSSSMGFPRQEYWSGWPFPSPVDHILLDLSTMTHPSWVAPQGMA